MNTLSAGALGGLAATVPMTAAMAVMHRGLPWRDRQPLPPHEIAMEVADRVQVADKLDHDQRFALTMASHFGYGSTVGLLFHPVTRRLPLSPVARGALYGLGVYAVSYFGLLPALGLGASGPRESVRRNGLLLVSHLVWGAALGLVAGALGAREAR